MAAMAEVFEIERAGRTLVVTPLVNLSELDYDRIQAGAQDLFALLSNGAIADVIIDFRRTDYYGSTALAFFVKLWKRVNDCKGRMVFCNVSIHETEILKITKLYGLWPICASREAALKMLGDESSQDPGASPRDAAPAQDTPEA